MSKRFGGTTAIKDVSFELRGGEVLALLGENGAGKSTCVKLLTGLYKPIPAPYPRRAACRPALVPLDAFRHGIAVVHQHPGLFRDLSVTENIFIGHMPRGPLGVDHEAMRERTARLLEIVGSLAARTTS